jgi:3-hydroxybutyryl-CoA dehydrogenase
MSNIRVAVIDGGNIGSSLAFDCALKDQLKGQNVVVVEKDELSCEHSQTRIKDIAAYARLFSPLAKDKKPEDVVRLIVWTPEIQAISNQPIFTTPAK